MSLKKPIIAVLTALTATLGISAIVAPVAEAAPSYCGSGDFCIYKDTGYVGGFYVASGADGNWANNYFNGTSTVVNNNDSSWFDNGITGSGIPSYVHVYDGFLQTGAMTICLRAGTGFPSKSISNDRGSSHGWYFGC